jgi:hypothetical protein
MTDARGDGEHTAEEIHDLLRRARAEAPPAPSTPERPASRSQPASNVERELTVDEIIEVVQRSIAQDQPFRKYDK